MSRQRIAYGPRRVQHGELWLPPPTTADVAYPVVVLLHGGFWKGQYTKRLMDPLAEWVAARGWAAWNLEYRRVGSIPGGGWPATFDDVAAGIDQLRNVPESDRLDLDRVVAVGHSAGGHLALWAAGRGAIAGVALSGVVALAPVSDLSQAADQGVGGSAVLRLLGGPPGRYPERYAAADPAVRLPTGVAQVLVHGLDDGAVPVAMSRQYVARAIATGDRAVLAALPGVGHMDLIDPASMAWARAATELAALVGD